ncbi:uncharacterized protein LOC122290084 [Carya illinoinensis]|uniref:uncharacterized protein LOC122290084 n=1 Tax=Carya illinoinensis TaxID=32201 RepID=UPI001C727C6A|nr:uncharacterized protein LOC122290084 [Carya illinoinensis]
MVDEVLERLGKFRLTEAEQKEVSVDISSDVVLKRHGQQCLIGMSVAERSPNKEAFKATMVRVWKPKGVLFKEVGENIFFIELQSEEDLMKVQRGRPWSFDRNLVCLNTFDGRSAPKNIEFTKKFLWIQLHNLPFGGMTREVGMQIGGLMGDVVKADVNGEGIGWGPYLRVKVAINIHHPLMRGINLNMDGTKRWISFLYEGCHLSASNAELLNMG